MSDGQNRRLPGLTSDSAVAVGVIVIIMMLLIPLPAVILDLFMSLNLLLGVLTILIVLYIKGPLEFSIFPTLLLVTTVFGLGLNVSSTRLILSKGALFDGKIVRAFGSFVVGSNGTEGLVIGLIIFIIIVAVQFMVITKGATRISEVAARFALDALPGKQMAIEAEYNSGALTEQEALKKKENLQREANFYGAMDGATKFVSGNVKISILITFINIIGGIVVGMTLHGEPFEQALVNYISLTIGDGLVSQFPTLFISVSTGLIVSRSVSDGSVGGDMSTQFTRYSKIYWVAAGFLGIMSVLPGFPWYVLMPMAILMGVLAYSLSRKEVQKEEKDAEAKTASEQSEAPAEMSPVVPLDPLSLELGYGLIPLVDKEQGAELLDRITRIRREAALDMGLVVPRIRIIDNMRLEPSEYCLKIKGVEVGRGIIRLNHYMAINPGGIEDEITGESTTDPAFGLPALWISEGQRDKAEHAGYTVVDAPSIIATHLTEILKKNAAEILGRQEVQSILDTLKNDYPAVVEEVKKVFSIGEIQKVFQGLLKEQVSIRNMVAILETLGDYGSVTKETGFLIEKVRQALGRQICLQYADDGKILRVITIRPDLEQKIIDARMETAAGYRAALDPKLHRLWINSLMNTVRNAQEKGYFPILLCSESARPLVKNSAAREIPDLVVLSVPEVVSDMKVESIGEISAEQVPA